MKGEGVLLAIDPGRHKCGLAVADFSGAPLYLRTVPAGELALAVAELLDAFPVSRLLLGDGTAADRSLAVLKEILAGRGLLPEKVDERGTTLLARPLYWCLFPPRGWRRLLPECIRPLPEPPDACAALLLARRWLK